MQVVRCQPANSSGKLQAFVDVKLGNGLIVRGFRIIHGSDGLFAVLPDKPRLRDGRVQVDENNNWVTDPVVWIDSAEDRRDFCYQVVQAYLRHTEQQGGNSRSAPEQSNYNNSNSYNGSGRYSNSSQRSQSGGGNRRPPQQSGRSSDNEFGGF